MLCTLCSVHCTLHSVLCTLQSLLCNPYSVLCTLCSVLCTRCLWVLFNKVSSFIIRSYIYIHTCQWYVWLTFLLTQFNLYKVSSCINTIPFSKFSLYLYLKYIIFLQLIQTHLSWSEANTCDTCDMMNIQTLQITVQIPLHTRFFSHMCFNLKWSLRASRFPNSLSHFLHGTFDLFAGSASLTNMCCFTLFLNENLFLQISYLYNFSPFCIFLELKLLLTVTWVN